MKDNEFWEKVKLAAAKLGVRHETFLVWKTRGRVSSKQQIPIYKALAKTRHRVTLEEIQKER